MNRLYETLLREHLKDNRQIAMLTGPRQVGKTTSARSGAGRHHYYSWDRQSDRLTITRGQDSLAEDLGLNRLLSYPLHVVLDEIHKYRSWRTFLKGFFDVYGDRTRIVVTGSALLGFFRRGGDSLMGRYFPYRMHPLSVAELACTAIAENPVRAPVQPERETIDRLLRFGGYPEPFLKGTTRFYNRWKRVHGELLFREDLRDLTRFQEVGQMEALGHLLASRAGQQVNMSHLALDVNVSVDTIRRWLAALEALFYSFTLRPWTPNISKTLRKQPKIYLWDWSLVPEEGARAENFIASHLLKAVHWWTDIGLGSFELFYLRDKAQREVDFAVIRNGKPWFLVEAKSSGRRSVSPALAYFQQQTGAAHAFQAAMDLPYIEADCFERNEPTIVPAATLLSQLV